MQKISKLKICTSLADEAVSTFTGLSREYDIWSMENKFEILCMPGCR